MKKDQKFRMKVHAHGGRTVLAVCDKGLIGRTISEKELSVTITESFYGVDLVNEGSFLSLLPNVSSANFIGNDCVDTLIEKGMVREEDVMTIAGIKHVQIYDLSFERGI
ncbi:MAG: DUF424 family protein [Thermoplasmatota archaeon]